MSMEVPQRAAVANGGHVCVWWPVGSPPPPLPDQDSIKLDYHAEHLFYNKGMSMCRNDGIGDHRLEELRRQRRFRCELHNEPHRAASRSRHPHRTPSFSYDLPVNMGSGYVVCTVRGVCSRGLLPVEWASVSRGDGGKCRGSRPCRVGRLT